VLAGVYHLGVAATLVAVLGGLPGLYLVWAAYRDDRRAEAGAVTGPADLADVADELAVAVRAQWAAEAGARRLDDPLLPVRWMPADPGLFDDWPWPSLVALATSGAGWPARSSSGIWAADASELAGEGGDIAGVLARVPTGRLVVLGGPGAGKTMLLVRLVLDLLARRNPRERVPFLVSLASWSPAGENLRAWLAAQMIRDHPALAAPVLTGGLVTSRAQALLDRGLILPVLDGLDEVPEGTWGAALTSINDALRPGEAVVVSCRSSMYTGAARPPYGLPVTLRGAAVVELSAVDAVAARQYLHYNAGDMSRWAPVLTALGTSTPVGQALMTPLMLSLARVIYNPRPGEYAGGLRDPADLCAPGMTSREMVEQHLLDGFISAAYRNVPGRADRHRYACTASSAERWLAFLARHLEYTAAGPDFAWWHLERAMPRTVSAIAAAAGAALGAGLTVAVTAGSTAGLMTRLVAALATGLITGLAIWLAGHTPNRPMTGVGWSLRPAIRSGQLRDAWRTKRIRTSGLLAVAAFPAGAVFTWLVFGLAVEPAWLVIGLFTMGVYGMYGDLAEVASPQAVLVRDRSCLLPLGLTAMTFAAAAGFLLGTACGRAFRPLAGAANSPALGVAAGLVFGVIGTLGFGMVAAAAPRWEIARGWLALRQVLPWRLMNFLEDAHQRGVLRQAGAVYQFRHVALQHRLAAKHDHYAGQTWVSSTCQSLTALLHSAVRRSGPRSRLRSRN
jgi:hypothetical protein